MISYIDDVKPLNKLVLTFEEFKIFWAVFKPCVLGNLKQDHIEKQDNKL